MDTKKAYRGIAAICRTIKAKLQRQVKTNKNIMHKYELLASADPVLAAVVDENESLRRMAKQAEQAESKALQKAYETRCQYDLAIKQSNSLRKGMQEEALSKHKWMFTSAVLSIALIATVAAQVLPV